MKFITIMDSAGVSRQIRTKHVETIEGGSNKQAKITLVSGSTYIIKFENNLKVLLDVIRDVTFLEIIFEPSPARITLVNIEFIQVIEQLTSASITTHYSTALCMRSGQVILSDRAVQDVANEIMQLFEHSRKD